MPSITKFPCEVCGKLTIAEKSKYFICPVCYWEDEEAGLMDSEYAEGPNGISLSQAKKNYLKFGAVKPDFIDKVRPPLQEEK